MESNTDLLCIFHSCQPFAVALQEVIAFRTALKNCRGLHVQISFSARHRAGTTPLLELSGHIDHINCVAFSADGTCIVPGFLDETNANMGCKNRQRGQPLMGHRAIVSVSPRLVRLL